MGCIVGAAMGSREGIPDGVSEGARVKDISVGVNVGSLVSPS